MCGIFGLLLRPGSKLSYDNVVALLSALYRSSETRGRESAGLYLHMPSRDEAWTLKAAKSASELLRTEPYQNLVGAPLRTAFGNDGREPVERLGLLAHSRLVTNGTAELPQNNQPVRWGGATMIHNGIVVNVDELWRKHQHLERRAEVDTEVMAALAATAVAQGDGPIAATASIFAKIRGAASVAWTHDRANWVVLATNTGDLFYHRDAEAGYLVFASERYILEQVLIELAPAPANGSRGSIDWLPPRRGIAVELDAIDATEFDLAGFRASKVIPVLEPKEPIRHHDCAINGSGAAPKPTRFADYKLLRYDERNVAALRRCTQCILPESFPFIDFDEGGTCSYCRAYRPRYAGMDKEASKQSFIKSLRPYRRGGAVPDTLVAFSGGRDSSYGLHLIKHEFGLNPVTFTYDWGMVTDLARRNIARICGQLGIQNILVSADIKQKRENIRRNVSAWLRKPDLGMIPLFMAGDKHFFRVVNQLKRQTGIKLDLWCANPLENTDFKSGFCGVPPDFDKKRVDYLSISRKAKLASYFGSRFLSNPSYLNGSLVDTAQAFFAYYVEPRRDFYFIFDHFPWEEKEVNSVLLDQYDWELAPDTRSTWRIGDGTAPFYNYIYVTASGFSEFDTFRSNQIREGMLARDEALRLVLEENRPRPQSIAWYLDTIGVDFDDAIRRINQLDTRGLHH
jgi:glutamine---fructose-6-phosphate transaminase (isomerizing)